MQKIVIASHNTGKLKEIQSLLAPLQIDVVTQSELNISEADEPFGTFIENALTKARHASLHSGLPALADDSGLCVAALNGAPGVYSARFACDDSHTEKSDARNNAKLLQVMQHQTNRQAYYYCVMVLVRSANDPQPLIADGLWHGSILAAPLGDGGFGYDPLFLDPTFNLTAAQLSPVLKNSLSHRAQALQALIEKLKSHI